MDAPTVNHRCALVLITLPESEGRNDEIHCIFQQQGRRRKDNIVM